MKEVLNTAVLDFIREKCPHFKENVNSVIAVMIHVSGKVCAVNAFIFTVSMGNSRPVFSRKFWKKHRTVQLTVLGKTKNSPG